jgi:hypothetical protein
MHGCSKISRGNSNPTKRKGTFLMNMPTKPENHIVVFSDHTIRRVFVDDAWWFSVIDVIQTLTDSTNARDYWYKMKVRVKEEDDSELSTFCRQFKLKANDGTMLRDSIRINLLHALEAK